VTDWTPVADVLALGVREGVFPGAVADVGRLDGPTWRHARGRLSYGPEAPPVTLDTIYDLASLTKVIATTALAMHLVEAGRLDLDRPLAAWLPEWRGNDRAPITPRDLLAHASGLPAWLPLFRAGSGLGAFVSAICRTPLAYAPRTASLYSDLGFILLVPVLEQAAGAPFETAVAGLWRAMGPDVSSGLAFRPAAGDHPIAPVRTEDERGPIPAGDVDDTNAWALGGVAGHAGVFGTVGGVAAFARSVMAALSGAPMPGTFGEASAASFTRPSGVPGSSRALGWDLMRPTASCGTRLSSRAFGHTGFTGTSLWIDPEAGFYVVLLSNRVHPAAAPNDGIQMVRRAVHDAVAAVLRR